MPNPDSSFNCSFTFVAASFLQQNHIFKLPHQNKSFYTQSQIDIKLPNHIWCWNQKIEGKKHRFNLLVFAYKLQEFTTKKKIEITITNQKNNNNKSFIKETIATRFLVPEINTLVV